MSKAKLKDTLRSMIREYGFDQVNKSLTEVRATPYHTEKSNAEVGRPDKDAVKRASTRKRKVTASQYVAQMELPLDKEKYVIELADRFDNKTFSPTFGDIASFCQIYGIDEPTSKTRASAIPRVFKFIASMEASDIRRIIDDGLFSGPSRLGPIADAIRRNGRARATTQPR